ncbi:hypothetical protein, partial [Micromonospora sp. RTP1Z1]|uniref:hypothetical protein n=1 Tax=Micromonospora sp. RTP1Z1 TaxID=2994043 RepID=UPI0029C7F50F
MPTPFRRSVLHPILLVLVPLSLLQTIWRLLPFPGTDPARVINGVLVLPPADAMEVLVVAVAWTWAVTAGVLALRSSDRPLREALRPLPTVCAALLAAIAVVLVAFLLVGLVLPVATDAIWVVVALVALPVGATLVPLALVPPIAVFEGVRGREAFRTAFAAVRTHVVSLAILLLFGVAAPAQLLGWLFRRPEDLVDGRLAGVVVWLLRDAALVGVAALQASTLVAAYQNLPEPRLPAAVPLPAGNDGGEAGGDGPGRTTWGRIQGYAVLLGLAALLLPTALAGGLVASERLPQLTVRSMPRPHQMIAVGWPDGRGPVLVGQQAIEDCLDDQCRTRRRTELSVLMYEPLGGAAFAPDGSVFALGQHGLEQCDARRVCRRSPGAPSALRGTGAGAIALAPTGEILIASGTEVGPRGDGVPDEARHVELKLVRCADVLCANPKVTSFGIVRGSLHEREGSWRPRRLTVGTDGAGRPVVAFRSPSEGTVSVGWCMSAHCERADLAAVDGPRRPGMPTGAELALLDFDDMFDCPGWDRCTAVGPVGPRPPPH